MNNGAGVTGAAGCGASLNSEELIKAVESSGLLVYKKEDSEKRHPKTLTGVEAYYAFLCKDLQEIAAKYKRNVDDIHTIFLEVSCKREKLIKCLEGQKVDRWKTLEDFALRKGVKSEEFQYVLSIKGEEAVKERMEFL